ncbi:MULTISPECIES: exonuclease domain-containing protein [Marisediminitalea]|jgi:DNA polymerase-3 subunit epsilon|uniref:exonuclease domain-containing protein n=1 Tax=Marisediminitalea TaxID=2662254 RepID=UPI0020CBA730|nr:exonuclease domain-containing protein [Marisediminitalea aggregata]MCP9476330.1 exonuclease domain-containing protein [Marisediminitalea aggregata]
MRKTLPERYYLDHFHEFLSFFDGANRVLLTDDALDFIDRFKALDDNAQCIVARAASRKYAVVVVKTFQYQEIHAPIETLFLLRQQNWFSGVLNGGAYAISQVLTKPHLHQLLLENGIKMPASASKNVLVDTFTEAYSKGAITESGELDSQYLFCEFDAVLRFLLFLYFGHTRGRLNQFSMRDLGVMRTRQDAITDSARFEHRKAAVNAYHYANALQQFKSLNTEQKRNFDPVVDKPVYCAIGHDYRDRLLFAMGQFWLSEDNHKALGYLKLAGSDNAREKWIRETYKAGNKDAAKETLEAIIDDPSSDTLLAFAEDFYQRKFGSKRTSVLTDMLREATRVISLDESYIQDVENGVVETHLRENKQAFRTENTLWRTLFGLFFWDWLHGEFGLVSEFDRRPQVLRHNDFYARCGEHIDAHLAEYCNSPDTLYPYLLKQATTHYGKVNSVFMWRQGLLDTIHTFLQYVDIQGLANFLRMMTQDYANLRDGFPDIMVIEDDTLWFEEIKAPGDQLRRNQLVTIQRLKQTGFNVGITQVNWYQDPMQPYVVVDIETTGGQGPQHRITEVGMVKMINGEEVARWQSLINPMRHIPYRITQLTGISDDMVVDAPPFEAVADDIDAFTRGCVFVAHNVNFDYGFIKQEFARLARPFRRPKLCTCARMRQHQSGLASYSLKALTRHFGIRLDNHHRALDDALAAAELLKIIQGEG